VRGGGLSNRDTFNTMTDPHPHTQGGDGLRSNPTRLSRRSAVRASTRNRNTTTAERHDSKLSTHTRFPVTTSFHTSILQPTSQPLSCLRRFSFEEDPIAFSTILAGRGETTGSSIAAVSEYVTPMPTPVQNFPTLSICQEQRPRRRSPVFSSRPPWSLAEELQAVGERTPEHGVEEVVQRRIPRTFEEILGKRKIPTALL
jgi:hypothetical protein